MTKENFRKTINGAHQLQLSEVVVRGRNGKVSVVATDIDNPSSNEFDVEVGTTDKDFQFVFKADNLKFLSGDYDVKISSKGIAHFKGETVQYWVATEASSQYN
jgi:hypothetical protein